MYWIENIELIYTMIQCFTKIYVTSNYEQVR